jgi:hypothetical protein
MEVPAKAESKEPTPTVQAQESAPFKSEEPVQAKPEEPATADPLDDLVQLFGEKCTTTEMDPLSPYRAAYATAFERTVKGFHLVNDTPIKESIWENLNAEIFAASGCAVESKSDGSHKSGADIVCSIGAISNKSSTYEKDGANFKISSYRLTSVCSEKDPSNPAAIAAEINSRKNYAYYSIIVRSETPTTYVYDWYLIPSSCPALNPETYTWVPTVGAKGKKKDSTIGWRTNMVDGSWMSISFSMSSQLWINFHITEAYRAYKMASAVGPKERKYTYSELALILNASKEVQSTTASATALGY